jgi:phosphate transport system protein
MTYRLQREIEQLKQQFLTLAAVVENNVRLSVQAFIEWNPGLAVEAIENDRQVNQIEVDLEEECLKVLALYQPVAQDLRFIVALLKINSDLERISDLAVHVAERAMCLADMRRVQVPFDFNLLGRKVQAMLRKSIDALVNLDATSAYEVCAADDEVDDMHRSFYTVFHKIIASNPSYSEEMTSYLGISRHLERIADLATNIAEDTVYMVNGDIIRHNRTRQEPPACSA